MPWIDYNQTINTIIAFGIIQDRNDPDKSLIFAYDFNITCSNRDEAARE